MYTVHVIVVIWARVICLICMPSALGAQRALGIHIRQITSDHVTTNVLHLSS